MKTRSERQNSWYFKIVVLASVPFAGVGIDLYAPSLPWIQHAFQVSPQLVKLTISTYLYGYAVGCLLFGLLSDAYGRKKMLYVGLVLYIVSCLLIVSFPNIHMMLSMRLLQGFAVGSVGVVSKAMITDTYDGILMKKMGAMMSTIWAIGPVVAPFIGGYLQHYFGWHANFYFLMAYAVLMLLLTLRLPETLPERLPLAIKSLLHHYRSILSHRQFWGGFIFMGAVYSLIVIFNVFGPFYIQQVLAYTPIQFGHIALIMGCAFLIGGVANRTLLNHFASERLILVSLLAMSVSVVLFLVVSYFFDCSLISFMLPVFLVLMCSAFLFPAGMSICLSLFPKTAGVASSLASFLTSVSAAVSTTIASYLHSQTPLPMAIAYLVLLAFCILAHRLIRSCPQH